MIYYDTPYLLIEWDDALKTVVMTWKGFAESKLFRSGLDKALELFESKNTNRWLSDLRGNAGRFTYRPGLDEHRLVGAMPESGFALYGDNLAYQYYCSNGN